MSFIDAFRSARTATSGGSSTVVDFQRVVLDDVSIDGEIPRWGGFGGKHLRLVGAIHVRDSVLIRLFKVRGLLRSHQLEDARLVAMSGRISTDNEQGINVYAWLKPTTDEDVRARIKFWPRAQPELAVSAEARRLRFETLAALDVPVMSLPRGTMRGYARLEGPTHRLALRADVQTEGGAIAMRALFADEGQHLLFASKGLEVRCACSEVTAHSFCRVSCCGHTGRIGSRGRCSGGRYGPRTGYRLSNRQRERAQRCQYSAAARAS